MRHIRLRRRDCSCELRVWICQPERIHYLVLSSAEVRGFQLKRSLVDRMQSSAVVVAGDGTGYSFGRNLLILRQSYICLWPCLASDSRVGSYLTIGVGSGVPR